MDKRIPVARAFFAIALIGLGIEHVLLQEFVTGRAPAWPEAMPGGAAWAYLSGVAFIAIGAAILSGKKARSAALLAGVLIFSWALLRHIPVVAADSLFSGAWTSAGTALTLVGGALTVAATFPAVELGRNALLGELVNLESEFIVAGRICLGLFLVQSGIQHFLYTEYVASLIPGWFPGNTVFWTYFTAVALIAGGIGLFIPRTARLAALLSGLMMFSFVWLVEIPRAFDNASAVIAVLEVLAMSGIALVMAGYLSRGAAAVKSEFPDRLPLTR